MACLTFEIKADRYNEVKEKYVYTDVAKDFTKPFMALFMQLKIGTYNGSDFFCLSCHLFLPVDKNGIFSKYLFFIEMDL